MWVPSEDTRLYFRDFFQIKCNNTLPDTAFVLLVRDLYFITKRVIYIFYYIILYFITKRVIKYKSRTKELHIIHKQQESCLVFLCIFLCDPWIPDSALAD